LSFYLTHFTQVSLRFPTCHFMHLITFCTMRELVSVPVDSNLEPPTGKGWSIHWTAWDLLLVVNCGIWNLFINTCFSGAYCTHPHEFHIPSGVLACVIHYSIPGHLLDRLGWVS
jgi:hypothetical protein